jgi:predicted nucleotidyltransferase
MKGEEVEKIKEFFLPLIEKFEDELKCMIVTGSAVRKERVEGSDIDIIILLDDHSEEYEKKDKKKTQKILKKIERKAGKEDYDLHIQPPKTVSGWYSVLLQGKPWAITSMMFSKPLYDPDGFQKTTREIIRNTNPKSTEKRAEKLENQAKKRFEKAEKRLNKGFKTIFENVKRTAKIFVKYREDRIISDRELENNLDNLLGDKIDTKEFRNLQKTVQQMKNRTHEPRFKELEEVSETAVELIKQLQQGFESELGEFQKQMINQTTEEIEESCKLLLEDKDIDYSEDEVFEKFREEVIDKGILNNEYWNIIKKTQHVKKESGEIDEESIYQTVAGLRELETAINSLIERDLFESFELHSDTDEARITPINELEEKMLDRYGDNIKGVYVVSTGNLLETDSATVVITVDSNAQKVKKVANQIELEIGEEHGFNIHTNVEEITSYWQRLQEGEEELVYEIKSSIVSYDPNGLIESTQKLVDKGKIPDTIPNIKKSIKQEALKSVMPVRKIKRECLKEYYNAAIKLGQSKLLRKGINPPVQKKVPQKMGENLIKTEETTQKEIDTIQKTINLFKNREYGKEDEIPAEKLDKIKKLENI